MRAPPPTHLPPSPCKALILSAPYWAVPPLQKHKHALAGRRRMARSGTVTTCGKWCLLRKRNASLRNYCFVLLFCCFVVFIWKTCACNRCMRVCYVSDHMARGTLYSYMAVSSTIPMSRLIVPFDAPHKNDNLQSEMRARPQSGQMTNSESIHGYSAMT